MMSPKGSITKSVSPSKSANLHYGAACSIITISVYHRGTGLVFLTRMSWINAHRILDRSVDVEF